jgi:hypothetical protein
MLLVSLMPALVPNVTSATTGDVVQLLEVMAACKFHPGDMVRLGDSGSEGKQSVVFCKRADRDGMLMFVHLVMS